MSKLNASASTAVRRRRQAGGTVVGVFIGIIVGLAIAAVTALMVNQASIPFLSRATVGADKPAVSAASEAAAGRADPEALPDPNRTSNALRPRPQPGGQPAPRSDVVTVNAADSVPDATAGTAPSTSTPPPLPPPAVVVPRTDATGAAGSASTSAATPAATPAGAASAPTSAAVYLLQAGAFRSAGEADAMRGRVLLMGYDAQVSQAEVNGALVYRVRVGPFNGLETMNRARSRLAENGVEPTVIRSR